jgi:hypothetical protein
MWSLPSLKVLNEQAESKGYDKKLERACRTGVLDRKKLVCEWTHHDEPSKCSGELRHYLHYDIFSDKPKGILTLCEHHDGYYGSPSEGFFECCSCQRVMIENITWERYETIIDGESFCLPCAAELHLAENSNWTPLTDAAIDALTFDDVRKAPHLIGVQMPIPKGIEFVNNCEWDSYSGQGISGGGVNELKDSLRERKAAGDTKAILIMDAAYQFAVSIGVYVPVKGGKYDVIA